MTGRSRFDLETSCYSAVMVALVVPAILLCGCMLLFSEVMFTRTQPANAAASDTLRLPSEAYPEISALVTAGRGTEAQERLNRIAGDWSKPQPVELLLLRAIALAEAGPDPASVDAWTRIAAVEPALEGFARRAIVTTLLRLDRVDEAETTILTSLKEGRRDQLELALQIIEKHQSAGRHERASSLSRVVLQFQSEGSAADRARLALAAALEAQGYQTAAVDILREAQLRHQDASTFVTAARADERLAKSLGRDVASFSESDYSRFADRLSRASRFEETLRVLREWRRRYPGSTQLDEIDADIVTALYNFRRNAEARQAARTFYESHPASPLVPRVRLVEFRLSVREGRLEDARTRGWALWNETRHPRDVRYGAGSLLAAYLVSVGRVSEGLDLYRELYTFTTDAGDKRNMLWRAGIAAVRAGQHERAVTNLQALVKQPTEGDMTPAAHYWLGIAEDRAGQDETAVRTFARVAERYNRHYYGYRARQQLDRLVNAHPQLSTVRAEVSAATSFQPTFPPLSLTETTRQLPDYRVAQIFAKAGLRTDAAVAARRALTNARNDRALALIAARASAAADQHRFVVGLLSAHFGQFLEQEGRGVPEDFWRLAYPRPYWDQIRSAAVAQGVDPVLLISLMRRESRFDPDARSPVGAVGLFQIMPYTATEIGPTAGVGAPAESSLNKPEVSAAIAARLVSRLQKQFGKNLAPLVAAYNAGEDRVAEWWESARDLPEDWFVDSIPYTETRGFVREVLTNYETYKRIYGEQTGDE